MGPVDFLILANKKRVTNGQWCVTLNREEEKKWEGKGGARLVLMILNINCFIVYLHSLTALSHYCRIVYKENEHINNYF